MLLTADPAGPAARWRLTHPTPPGSSPTQCHVLHESGRRRPRPRTGAAWAASPSFSAPPQGPSVPGSVSKRPEQRPLLCAGHFRPRRHRHCSRPSLLSLPPPCTSHCPASHYPDTFRPCFWQNPKPSDIQLTACARVGERARMCTHPRWLVHDPQPPGARCGLSPVTQETSHHRDFCVPMCSQLAWGSAGPMAHQLPTSCAPHGAVPVHFLCPTQSCPHPRLPVPDTELSLSTSCALRGAVPVPDFLCPTQSCPCLLLPVPHTELSHCPTTLTVTVHSHSLLRHCPLSQDPHSSRDVTPSVIPLPLLNARHLATPDVPAQPLSLGHSYQSFLLPSSSEKHS